MLSEERALELKYFVLKPRSKEAHDPYAKASRFAILTYAEHIKNVDALLAKELVEWVGREYQHADSLDPLSKKGRPPVSFIPKEEEDND